MTEKQFSTTARWGEVADSYKTHVSRMTISGASELVSLAAALKPIDETSNILDNGAGAGAVTRNILSRYPSIRITAADINQQMLDAIDVESPKLEKRVVDARSLCSIFPNQQFSHVFCSFVLHVITTPLDCLKEMRAVLQQSPRPGVIGVSIWGAELAHLDIWMEACRSINPDYTLPQLVDDAKPWRTETEIRANLLAAGFADVQTKTTYMPWPWDSAEAYADFWFGVSGANPIAEGCIRSIDEADLGRVRSGVENVVRDRYGNGRLITEQAVLAVARA